MIHRSSFPPLTQARRVLLAVVVLALPAQEVAAGGRIERLSMSAPSLGQASRDVRVYVPPSYERPDASGRPRRFPVVYLLHGFPGGSGDWIRRGDAAAIADTLIARGEIPELLLVCPDGNRGFYGRSLYANSWDGRFRMEDFIRHDLVAWTDSVFRTIREADARGVIGLSDGGTGAVNLLLRHPDVFGAAGAHSADFRLAMGFGMRSIVGPNSVATANLAALSPLEELRAGRVFGSGAKLYFDCGTEDESLADDRALHALLLERGVRHDYAESSGSHTWEYWRARLPHSLRAVAGALAHE